MEKKIEERTLMVHVAGGSKLVCMYVCICVCVCEMHWFSICYPLHKMKSRPLPGAPSPDTSLWILTQTSYRILPLFCSLN